MIDLKKTNTFDFYKQAKSKMRNSFFIYIFVIQKNKLNYHKISLINLTFTYFFISSIFKVSFFKLNKPITAA